MTEGKVTFSQRDSGSVCNSRGTDILESLSAKEDINYLTNAGSSAVIDLAEFEEKEINRDSLRELSFKNTSGRGVFCKRSAGVGAGLGRSWREI